ncbi:DUF3750 domain-containing protein [Propylenella binzhouense]|uniref:DUF3750 domain-containing protein n=1 Tax=Propylenella binzhouense TaxID=2555902 RepID=A0A964T7P3_9HYPH|nr:DUF3750 domain-containing protein [Propylenella binzhouense]MYZ49980.1 DUF3750 domain-containing protein [Propylenella binzhouense]
MRSTIRWSAVLVILLFIAPVLAHGAVWIAADRPSSWRDADWSSAGILPSPRAEPEASIRILAARTGGLKGAVAVHTWLVLKHAGADGYDRYEVTAWGLPVRRNRNAPDGRWYSNEPEIIYALRGAEAAALLPKVEAAIAAYPWSRPGTYRVWPGPNSNTFVASVIAAVPELGAELPPTAIGRDYRTGFFPTPSGGWAVSLGGLAGVAFGIRDGLQISLLGLVAGVRFTAPALILPGFGAIGAG